MKEILKFKNLLFLSIFILLSSCGQTIDVDDEENYLLNLSSLGGITSYKGIPYTGEIVKYVDDEKTQLEWKKTFEEGKLDGLSEEYNKNGQLEESVTYNEGEVEEEVIYKYYENGLLRLKATYNKDEKSDGPVESYHENGQLNIKSAYKEGELDGAYESYYENYYESYYESEYESNYESNCESSLDKLSMEQKRYGSNHEGNYWEHVLWKQSFMGTIIEATMNTNTKATTKATMKTTTVMKFYGNKALSKQLCIHRTLFG